MKLKPVNVVCCCIAKIFSFYDFINASIGSDLPETCRKGEIPK